MRVPDQIIGPVFYKNDPPFCSQGHCYPHSVFILRSDALVRRYPLSNTTGAMNPHATHQPMSLNFMDCYYDDDSLYYTPHICECTAMTTLRDRACHTKSHLRRILIPASLAIMTVAIIIFISCIRDLNTLGVFSTDYRVMGVGRRSLSNRDSSEVSESRKNQRMFLIRLGHRWTHHSSNMLSQYI